MIQPAPLLAEILVSAGLLEMAFQGELESEFIENSGVMIF
jgi:hypothetical protein